jgi:hypothetical protein
MVKNFGIFTSGKFSRDRFTRLDVPENVLDEIA